MSEQGTWRSLPAAWMSFGTSIRSAEGSWPGSRGIEAADYAHEGVPTSRGLGETCSTGAVGHISGPQGCLSSTSSACRRQLASAISRASLPERPAADEAYGEVGPIRPVQRPRRARGGVGPVRADRHLVERLHERVLVRVPHVVQAHVRAFSGRAIARVPRMARVLSWAGAQTRRKHRLVAQALGFWSAAAERQRRRRFGSRRSRSCRSPRRPSPRELRPEAKAASPRACSRHVNASLMLGPHSNAAARRR